VRCKREDLLIENITLKDSSVMKKAMSLAGYHNKVAAAEAYILSALTRLSLDVQDFHDPYGDVCIASVLVEPKVS